MYIHPFSGDLKLKKKKKWFKMEGFEGTHQHCVLQYATVCCGPHLYYMAHKPATLMALCSLVPRPLSVFLNVEHIQD